MVFRKTLAYKKSTFSGIEFGLFFIKYQSYVGAERNATGYIELAHCFIQGMKKYLHYIQNKIIEVKLVGRHAEELLQNAILFKNYYVLRY